MKGFKKLYSCDPMKDKRVPDIASKLPCILMSSVNHKQQNQNSHTGQKDFAIRLLLKPAGAALYVPRKSTRTLVPCRQ